MQAQFILHKVWKTPQSYGSPETRGLVVYRIGGALCQTQYYVYEQCVTMLTSQLGVHRAQVIGEVGFDFAKGSQPGKEAMEKFIDDELVPILCMCVDGR